MAESRQQVILEHEYRVKEWFWQSKMQNFLIFARFIMNW